MQLNIEVDLGEGPFTVTTNLWVIVQWERRFKRKASDLANGTGMEDIAYMAYEACKTNGITVPAVFDDFVKRAKSITPGEVETPTPTDPAPTAEV
jgi:hypothetical protein